jgi:hypothetical protein
MTKRQPPAYPFRLYGALLLLYPKRFQIRFGPEMVQVFEDSLRFSEVESGLLGFFDFWMRTLPDHFASIVREWRHEITRNDCELDVTGLADSFMITVVVGTNLLFWGWTGASFALDLSVWTTEAFVLMGIVTVFLGLALGILSAMFVARNGRFQPPRIKV